MKPFAMDFGSSLEKHVVQRGETLASIAQNLYGNAYSWKEISALNPSLESPDSLEVGQELYLQPKNVDSQAYLASLIAQTEQSSSQPPTAQASNDQSPTITDSSSNPTAPPSEEDSVSPPVEQRPEIVASQNIKRPQPGVGGWWKSMSANGDSSNYFAIGLVLILGAIIFLVVNKRRKAAIMHRDEITNLTDFN